MPLGTAKSASEENDTTLKLLKLVRGNLVISQPHQREPWPKSGCEYIFVNAKYEILNGKAGGARIPRKELMEKYIAAKRGLDHMAAADVVDAIIREDVVDRIVDAVWECGVAPIIVYPSPGFEDHDSINGSGPSLKSMNALPAAYASYLQKTLGGEVDNRIHQKARVGRTGMSGMARFVWQPAFEGEVLPGKPYVVVEDMVTLGGTLACLTSYIHKNGGKVIAVTSLGSSKGLLTSPLALRDNTLSRLFRVYSERFSTFWMETIGHAGEHLTDEEGCFLADFAERWAATGPRFGDTQLQRLRNALVSVCEKGK
ncbi:phosphoribosyltransferase [uncultured Salinicola sp.]|uniref:phosphoribosyltransferase n=1 Tax=uncultured Salinicola sp. TaxID=1193542 RepID=UPI0026382519|nr:phosphoribosyltransferase [uncultured Salinicola sp.]|tara:strand:+ start:3071 stop:4009 length:939 start_codon:yes stop_codon:yes gene_type:complete